MPFGPFKKRPTEVESASTIWPNLALSGQTMLTSKQQAGNLGLVGPKDKVLEAMAEMVQSLDIAVVPIYLLGMKEEDAELLALPLNYPLNAVRTVPLPILPGATAATVRDLLEEIATSSHRTSFADQPAYLFVGRHLGPQWLSVLGRAGALKENRVVVVADISLQLKTSLQTLFGNYLVWPDERRAIERSLERLHRHDKVKPNYEPRWTNIGATLLTKS